MPRVSVWLIRTALSLLGVGISLGGYILSNKGLLFDVAARRWLPLHLELLIFGWLCQFACGVAVWIVPRFTHEPRYGDLRWAWAAYGLLNGGLGLTLLGWWFSVFSLVLVGRGLEIAAFACLARLLWPRIKGFGV